MNPKAPRSLVQLALSTLLAGLISLPAAAQERPGATTKDIVIDRISAPHSAQPVVGGAAPMTDAMSVSVLLESPDGTLTPRGTDRMFKTQDRFRVRVLASREGRIAFYNTNALGQTQPAPVWTGTVKPGQETISPRLKLEGASGVDTLHVILEPIEAGPQGIAGWLQSWLSKQPAGATGKDIRLDVQHSPSASYVLGTPNAPQGGGLRVDVRIAHQ